MIKRNVMIQDYFSTLNHFIHVFTRTMQNTFSEYIKDSIPFCSLCISDIKCQM